MRTAVTFRLQTINSSAAAVAASARRSHACSCIWTTLVPWTAMPLSSPRAAPGVEAFGVDVLGSSAT
ncbi:hypothetical protein HH308_07545 [Gordonia sp. TBRC 11910]|uniref:Uncharacterized protein n=1 Tax=Gordonia asplenii TaxID=2725283 RepID=A0A848L052_9ACTN|nr:hypothetical protein [Gordonia asplenii]NMO01068.1 hypothetical protein [Gordonia asplenii]